MHHCLYFKWNTGDKVLQDVCRRWDCGCVGLSENVMLLQQHIGGYTLEFPHDSFSSTISLRYNTPVGTPLESCATAPIHWLVQPQKVASTNKQLKKTTTQLVARTKSMQTTSARQLDDEPSRNQASSVTTHRKQEYRVTTKRHGGRETTI